MWAFMTSGSAPFLKQLTEKHRHLTFYFMTKGTNTVVYYEDTKKKSIFVSGRTYEMITRRGELHEKGFVSIETIPVSDDHQDIFEQRAEKMLETLQLAPGLRAIRFLKQHKKATFVILLQWRSEQDYRDWEKSPFYDRTNFVQQARLPAYFIERPFRVTYHMLDEEE